MSNEQEITNLLSMIKKLNMLDAETDLINLDAAKYIPAEESYFGKVYSASFLHENLKGVLASKIVDLMIQDEEALST